MIEQVPRLDLGADTNLLRELIKVYNDRRPMNVRRSVYADGEAPLRDFGISIPPEMANIRAALGWVGNGLRAVTDRSEFEDFVMMDGSSGDPFELASLLDTNHFHQEFQASKVSSAMHGCSFTTISHGDVQSGEPEVQIIARAAEDSAALWDRRRRGLRGFLSVVETKDGRPIAMVMYTPETVYDISRKAGRWQALAIPNPLGEVSVAANVYGYELRRPLGHSRITRSAMYYSDAALRTIVRSEVSAELYASVQMYLFGPDVVDMVGNDRWAATMGRINAMDFDRKDEYPELHRFNGASPTPHVEHLRMLATMFAEDQALDVKFADTSNPASADAIFAAKESLITTTRQANRTWGYGAQKAARLAIRLRDGFGSEEPAELLKLRTVFTDPAIVSPSARAAAFTQLSGQIDGFATTTVGLQYAGLSQEQIVRLQSERARAQAPGVLDRALAATGGAAVSGAAVEATEMKAKLEALGAGVRAGADPADVAERLGLSNLKFTGATPVALRLPKDEAAELEER
ncbi:hypothetical protein ACWGOE_07320 [Leucobacter chromiiresistens]